jgi:hypothetical protein
MAMLMPKEVKVETAHATISSLTDEQLQAMVHELKEHIAAKLSAKDAKVINGKTGDPAALPQPAKPDKPWRPRRTRKAAKALKAITADCETNVGEEPLK